MTDQGFCEVPKCLRSHERYLMTSVHLANSRISFLLCDSCGWIDTEDIIERTLEKFGNKNLESQLTAARKEVEELREALKWAYGCLKSWQLEKHDNPGEYQENYDADLVACIYRIKEALKPSPAPEQAGGKE